VFRLPEHDHAKDGQEEVYVVLKGSATLVADRPGVAAGGGRPHSCWTDDEAPVPPGDRGVTLLALGATPGRPTPGG